MSEITVQDAAPRPKSGNSRGASHWQSKNKRHPLENDQALRQGRISNCAFIAMGREQAIAFLNTDNPTLGGRPLAIATASADGEELVMREIEHLKAANRVPYSPATAEDVR